MSFGNGEHINETWKWELNHEFDLQLHMRIIGYVGIMVFGLYACMVIRRPTLFVLAFVWYFSGN